MSKMGYNFKRMFKLQLIFLTLYILIVVGQLWLYFSGFVTHVRYEVIACSYVKFTVLLTKRLL